MVLAAGLTFFWGRFLQLVAGICFSLVSAQLFRVFAWFEPLSLQLGLLKLLLLSKNTRPLVVLRSLRLSAVSLALTRPAGFLGSTEALL